MKNTFYVNSWYNLIYEIINPLYYQIMIIINVQNESSSVYLNY